MVYKLEDEIKLKMKELNRLRSKKNYSNPQMKERKKSRMQEYYLKNKEKVREINRGTGRYNYQCLLFRKISPDYFF